MDMDFNKLKRSLEIADKYLFKGAGLVILLSGFWLFFTEQISERMFIVGMGAGSLLGIFGRSASLNFLKFIKEKKDVTGS